MKWKNCLLCALVALATLFALPAMAENMTQDTDYQTTQYSPDGADATIVGTHTLTGVDVELLYGSFGVEDETQMLFVAVDQEGDIQLYCALSDTTYGGMPGEVIQLSDKQIAFLADGCVTGDSWREKHRERQLTNTGY